MVPWPSMTGHHAVAHHVEPLEAVPLQHRHPRTGGVLDERGVELEAGRDGGEQAVTGGQRQGHLPARRTAEHRRVDPLELRHRAHVEAEVGQLAQGERGQAVATALVAGKARLVDDEHVDPGPVQLDRRGNARRPGADHEDVDGRGHRTMLGSAARRPIWSPSFSISALVTCPWVERRVLARRRHGCRLLKECRTARGAVVTRFWARIVSTVRLGAHSLESRRSAPRSRFGTDRAQIAARSGRCRSPTSTESAQTGSLARRRRASRHRLWSANTDPSPDAGIGTKARRWREHAPPRRRRVGAIYAAAHAVEPGSRRHHERAGRGDLDEQGRAALRRGRGGGYRRARLHHREHRRGAPAGAADVPGRARVGSRLGDVDDGDLQPGDARARPAGRDARSTAPRRRARPPSPPSSSPCTTRARRRWW